MRGLGLGKRGWGWRREGCARVGGREGCERVGLEEEKGCEGKVEWGWRKGRGVRERWSEGLGLEGAESEERRGRTTRIELKIWDQ